MYPILDLRRLPLQQDLHWYLRQLEEVVIRCAWY
jgi:lipoate-protein ligase B